jgi:hypothetical protein
MVTAIVGVNVAFNGVVLIGDTRLTTYRDGQVLARRDVCQKLFAATPWAVVGFAGAVCPARTLLAGVIGRVRSYPENEIETWMKDGTLDWLRDDEHLTHYLHEGLRHHGGLGAAHEQCVERGIELMIAWVDYRAVLAQPKGDRHPVTPQLISVHLPGFRHLQIGTKRTGFGVHVIGSGALVEPALRERDVLLTTANFSGGQHSNAGRCMFVAETLRREIDRVGDPTVGGLYQLMHLSTKATVTSVSYFYWNLVEPGYGTYVAMRRDQGRWVQEHRPSGSVVRILSPFELPDIVPETDQLFEPSRQLTRTSAGVIPAVNPLLLYTEYQTSNLPAQVVASWGPQPPAEQD